MRVKIKTIQAKEEEFLNQNVLVKGWIRSARKQKQFSFIEINDGSCQKNLQIIADTRLEKYQEFSEEFNIGAAISVNGCIMKSPAKGQSLEMQAEKIEIVGTCPASEYPLQKKRHSFEFLRDIAHLRPRSNSLSALTRVRNELAFASHRFFQEKDFLYVHTPIITAADCEGAGEMFRVSTLKNQAADPHEDFFGKPTYLTVSGQLNAEIYAQAFSDVYTFGPTFRAENSNTSRHLAEFWMIEPEMAFADIHDDMDCAEDYIKYVIEAVFKACPDEMQLFDQYIQKGLIDRLRGMLDGKFERIRYTEAIDILQKSKKKFEFPITWGKDLQSEHERFLVEEHFKKPVIVRDYPAQIKAFYMRANDDQKTVAAMDVLAPGVGEIIGGSQREERLSVLEEKLKNNKLDPKDYWWYLELRKFGSTPHAGFGVGFERLVQFVTGMENIRETIPFPRYPGHADF